MPKKLHDKLARQATRMGLTGERRQAYIYGTMQRIEKGTTVRSTKSRASATGVAKSARGQARAASNRVKATGKPTKRTGITATARAKTTPAKRRRRY